MTFDEWKRNALPLIFPLGVLLFAVVVMLYGIYVAGYVNGVAECLRVHDGM